MACDKNNVTDACGVDDEGWLYRDDCGEDAEEKTRSSQTPALDPKEAHGNGVDTEEPGEDTEDSDSDDDVCVTIGDIKTAESSQSTGFGSTPVNLNIKAEGRTHSAVETNSKGVDLDALGSIQEIPIPEIDIKCLEEKPWRKPGAEVSDYFNYGFNEETWKSYCNKQKMLFAISDSTISPKIRSLQVHREPIGQEDKGSGFDSPPSYSQFNSASRNSSFLIDVIGGQTGSISGGKYHRCHGIEENGIQVLPETSSDGDPSANEMSSFLPLNIPPPPFLPFPSNVNSSPSLILPRWIPPPPTPPPSSIITALNSECSAAYDGAPILRYPFTPGGSPLILGNVTSQAGMIDIANACEYYERQDREREHAKGKDRPRERGHDKYRERGRDREREHSSSKANRSEEEQVRRCRDRMERGHSCHRDRPGREREERHREWRHRDEDKGRHKSSHSTRRRRHRSETRDSRYRHKHKKVKRSKENRETSPEVFKGQGNESGLKKVTCCRNDYPNRR
ncbi:pre-mRNA 3'-end-processing factor FIP1 [Lampris incognitus]|uniref:pre-mRNA 3'-end-processing factor FIP1 n=1 Tax=Lampris incognitus TaxID=2546036 RepID=UPI0024B599A4|nr:pre-mRNA 3'-end-processing factor FIP1 [Lampris incognitus]